MSAPDGAEEGEGYFASVSDLMVGILFVFLLMLTVFALNFRDDEAFKLSELRDAQRAAAEARERAEAQQARNDRLRELLRQALARMEADIDARQAARRRLLANLEERLRKDGIAVTVDPDSGVLRLPEGLLFARGSSALEPTARAPLAALARSLDEVLPCFAAGAAERPDCGPGDRAILEAVLVEGHSDRQGYRFGTGRASAQDSRDRNDRLASERALSVFREVQQDASLDALRNANGLQLLGVSAYGDRRPIAEGTGEAEYQRNRRIDLRFLLSSRTSNELQRLIDEIRPALEDAR